MCNVDECAMYRGVQSNRFHCMLIIYFLQFNPTITRQQTLENIALPASTQLTNKTVSSDKRDKYLVLDEDHEVLLIVRV